MPFAGFTDQNISDYFGGMPLDQVAALISLANGGPQTPADAQMLSQWQNTPISGSPSGASNKLADIQWGMQHLAGHPLGSHYHGDVNVGNLVGDLATMGAFTPIQSLLNGDTSGAMNSLNPVSNVVGDVLGPTAKGQASLASSAALAGAGLYNAGVALSDAGSAANAGYNVGDRPMLPLDQAPPTFHGAGQGIPGFGTQGATNLFGSDPLTGAFLNQAGAPIAGSVVGGIDTGVSGFGGGAAGAGSGALGQAGMAGLQAAGVGSAIANAMSPAGGHALGGAGGAGGGSQTGLPFNPTAIDAQGLTPQEMLDQIARMSRRSIAIPTTQLNMGMSRDPGAALSSLPTGMVPSTRQPGAVMGNFIAGLPTPGQPNMPRPIAGTGGMASFSG